MPDELDLLGDRRSMPAGANGQRPMRVLLVDDHEISRTAISALLHTQGAEVRNLGSLGTQQGADGRTRNLVVIDQQDSHGPLAVGARSQGPASAGRVELVRHVFAH